MAKNSSHESNSTARRADRLRKLPRTQYIQWAVGELGGKWRIGWGHSRGFQGHIIVSPAAYRALDNAPLEECVWYPIQVKQKDKAGRPDIDAFEAVMIREDRKLGYFVAFDFTGDALFEIDRFQRKEGRTIKPLTVREILEEEIAMKLA